MRKWTDLKYKFTPSGNLQLFGVNWRWTATARIVPTGLSDYIDSAAAHPKLAIMVQRAKRSEGLGFRLLYHIYTQAFAFSPGSASISGIFAFCLSNTWSGS